MTTARDMAAQGALFGDDTPVPTTSKTATAATNDPELVAAVVRSATTRGYVLIGPAERVYLRDAAPAGRAKACVVEPVPAYEAETVRQLLDAGHLTRGGAHRVSYGRNEGPATSVLVPKATTAMVQRWANLRPLRTPTPPPPVQAVPDAPEQRRTSGKGSRRSCGRIFVDVVRPGLGLVTSGNGEFSGSIVRQDGRYLVETEHGSVIGRASSFRAGAQVLARHHGFTSGPVEIDHEQRPD